MPYKQVRPSLDRPVVSSYRYHAAPITTEHDPRQNADDQPRCAERGDQDANRRRTGKMTTFVRFMTGWSSASATLASA